MSYKKIALSVLACVASFGLAANMAGSRIVISIFVVVLTHELFHLIGLIRSGQGVRIFILTPLFGLMAPKNPTTSARDYFYVYLLGPTSGVLVSLFGIGMYDFTGEMIYLSIAFLSGVINLTQFLPAFPLDGGQMLDVIIRDATPKQKLIDTSLAMILTLSILWYYDAWFLTLIIIAFFVLDIFYWEPQRSDFSDQQQLTGILLAVGVVLVLIFLHQAVLSRVSPQAMMKYWFL